MPRRPNRRLPPRAAISADGGPGIVLGVLFGNDPNLVATVIIGGTLVARPLWWQGWRVQWPDGLGGWITSQATAGTEVVDVGDGTSRLVVTFDRPGNPAAARVLWPVSADVPRATSGGPIGAILIEGDVLDGPPASGSAQGQPFVGSVSFLGGSTDIWTLSYDQNIEAIGEPSAADWLVRWVDTAGVAGAASPVGYNYASSNTLELTLPGSAVLPVRADISLVGGARSRSADSSVAEIYLPGQGTIWAGGV